MTIEEIKKSGRFTPGLVGGETMNFLLADKDMYYLKRADQDSYLKDDNGKYVKLHIDEVVQARYRYLSENFEKEKEQSIDREYERLGKELTVKAAEIVKFVEEKNKWLTGNVGILGAVLRDHNPQQYEASQREAVDFFRQHPTVNELVASLQELAEVKNYEGLHQMLGGHQEPLGTFKLGSASLKRIFSKDALPQTLNDLTEKGALYVMARVNVEKRYFPE